MKTSQLKTFLMSVPGRREDGADTWWYRMYWSRGRLRCYRNLGQGSTPPRGRS